MTDPSDPRHPARTLTHDPAADPSSAADHRGETAPAAAPPPAGAAEDPPFRPSDRPGDVGRLGRYRVVRRLGAGGMGAVYLGHDDALRRPVALKVMLPRYAADRPAHDRFLREARAAAGVRSDHVVAILDVGEEDGVPFIAMEYLRGYPLDEYLRRHGRLTVPQLLRVGREAAAGLAAAHALGLVHRDVKPANLWLEAPTGRVKVLDFGLARRESEETEITGTGAVVGTPAYMSPEQARGERVGARTDLFSLGAVLYKAATGRPPFDGPTVMAVLTALATADPPPVLSLAPDVPPPVAWLIHRLLAKDPAARPASAEAVGAELAGVERALAAGELSAADAVPLATAVGDGPPGVGYAPIAVSAAGADAFADLDAGPYEVPARPTRRAGWGAWAAGVASVMVLAGMTWGLARVIRESARPAPEQAKDQPTDPSRPPAAQPSPTAKDPDRVAAEWALSRGWAIWIDGLRGDVKAPPDRPFRLTGILLASGVDGGAIRDADLGHLRHLEHLEYLALPGDVTDRGLELLAGFPFAGRLTHLGVTGPAVTEAGLAHLARFRSLRELELRGVTRLTAAGLARAAELPELEQVALAGIELPPAPWAAFRRTKLSFLYLHGCSVPTGGLGGLREVPTLTALALAQSRPAEGVLGPLAGHPGLRELVMTGGTAPDAALSGVSGLPALEKLHLAGIGVGDQGVSHLAGAKSLRVLRLNEARVTDAGLAPLAGLTGLRELDLGKTRVGDAGLEYVARLPALKSVVLREAEVTDAGLPRLIGLRSLETADVSGTRVTAAGVDGLRAARPDVRVVSDADGKP